MSVTIGYAVTHVPGSSAVRTATVEAQRTQLGDRLHVVEDPDRIGVWPTTRSAYELLLDTEPDATHLLVLQDDMELCNEFDRTLTDAIEARPDAAVCVFSMRKAVKDALDTGLAWVETTDAVWGGSTVLPRPWVERFLTWEQRSISPRYRHDDRRLAYWLLKVASVPVWLTAPSLVQHVAPSESLLGHSNRTRVSNTWTADPPPAAHWATEALTSRSSTQWVNQVEQYLIPNQETPMAPTVTVEVIPIDNIKPYWRNPRNATDKAIEALMDSITRYGYQNPITVDTEHVVITGHTRLIALRRLGWTDIPVLVSDLDAQRAKEFRVIDNRTAEHTTWNRDNLVLELREFADTAAMELHFPEVDLSLEFDTDNLDLDTDDLDRAAANLDSTTTRTHDEPQQVTCPHCYEQFDLTR